MASPALLARFSEDAPMKGAEVVSEKVEEFSVPVCSKEQVDLQKVLFDYGNNAGKMRIPTSIVTRCPDDSSWLNEYFAKLPNTKPFIAINVGCNKGLDAVALAGLFSQDCFRRTRSSRWISGINLWEKASDILSAEHHKQNSSKVLNHDKEKSIALSRCPVLSIVLSRH